MRQSGPVSLSSSTRAERVAVIGAGAVGCMLAAHLASAGCDIVICGRAALERIVMTIGDGTVEHKVAWAAEPGDLPELRYAVLATKIHHTADVADWLRALRPGTVLIAARNARRTGRGEVRVTSTGRGLVVPDDEPGRAAAALFAGGGVEVETADDFPTAAWEKLLSNVIANPLTALTGRPMEVLSQGTIAALGLGLALETVEVARAEGASLTPQHALDALAWLQGLPGTLLSSMLQDRAAGQTTEHQGLLGPVVRLGQQHGIPTPLTSAILALLDALPVGAARPGA